MGVDGTTPKILQEAENEWGEIPWDFPFCSPSILLAVHRLAKLLNIQRAVAPGRHSSLQYRAQQGRERDGTQVKPTADLLRSGNSWRDY